MHTKTIIVSNRLPVKVEIDGDAIAYQNSEGGLATGLSGVYKNTDSLWIGWYGIPTRNIQLHHRIAQDLEEKRLVPVMLSQEEVSGFYEGFSNETLWPLFHYFPTYARFDNEQWDTYVSVNRKFADAILAVAKPGDTIWVHDYHLLLVPDMVRQSLPEASIGFFQHIPFPAFEIFRLLPWRDELLRGLMGADLIGFHTYDDVKHFLEAAASFSEVCDGNASVLLNEILLEDDRTVTVEAFPMGIDYDYYKGLSDKEETQRIVERIEELTAGQQLMISIDRLDYSKGIVHRLKAYDLFLSEHPELHEQVTFLQLIVPSRDTVAQYALLHEEVNQLVSDINIRYGTLGWQPIRYFYRSLSPEQLSALYVSADVALVTPLRDGMNLVSKEFVASRLQQDGVLVLSEMAGAARELTEAILVNPFNDRQMSDAIFQALTMPLQEQRERITFMQQRLGQATVHYWAASFLENLESLSVAQRAYHLHFYNAEMEDHVLHGFISGGNAANVLDHLHLPPMQSSPVAI